MVGALVAAFSMQLSIDVVFWAAAALQRTEGVPQVHLNSRPMSILFAQRHKTARFALWAMLQFATSDLIVSFKGKPLVSESFPPA